MAMPSETVMVLNTTLFAPAASAPFAASSASVSMCMLQGVVMLQVEAMPICGFKKVFRDKTDRVQHRPARRLLDAVDYDR